MSRKRGTQIANSEALYKDMRKDVQEQHESQMSTFCRNVLQGSVVGHKKNGVKMQRVRMSGEG